MRTVNAKFESRLVVSAMAVIGSVTLLSRFHIAVFEALLVGVEAM